VQYVQLQEGRPACKPVASSTAPQNTKMYVCALIKPGTHLCEEYVHVHSALKLWRRVYFDA